MLSNEHWFKTTFSILKWTVAQKRLRTPAVKQYRYIVCWGFFENPMYNTSFKVSFDFNFRNPSYIKR